MNPRPSVLFSLLSLAFTLTAPAQEDEARSALVVGVESYSDRYFTPLGAPVADARAFQAKLQALGFQSDLLINPTKRQLTEAVDTFGSTLARRGGIGLFYFSGHGSMKSDESGANYLIPAGTNIRTENDLPEEAFNAQRIANRMMEVKNRLSLVFLDACRNHGLPRGDGAKSSGGGLAAMRGASGLMFFFATQPGEVAFEDTSKRSLFTTALLKHMGTPGISFMEMMGDVTAETEETSFSLTEKKFRQSPFVTGTIRGRFYFRPTKSITDAPAASVIFPPATPSEPSERPVNELPSPLVPSLPASVLTSPKPLKNAPTHANPKHSQNKKMRRVQEKLKAAGMYQGNSDGAAGPNTENAIMEWQRQQGLPQTGKIDPETQASLDFAEIPEKSPPSSKKRIAPPRPNVRSVPNSKPTSRPLAKPEEDFFKDS